MISQKKDFAQSVGEFLGKWFDRQLAEQLMAGLLTERPLLLPAMSFRLREAFKQASSSGQFGCNKKFDS